MNEKALEDFLLRMERLEEGLVIKIDRFTESEQALMKWRKELTLEVEELKALKSSLEGSLPATIRKTMKEDTQAMMSQVVSLIVKGFQEKTKEIVDSTVKETESLRSEVNKTISQAANMIGRRKWEMTWHKIWVTAVFFCGSMLTALSIFYFFPQHVNYGLTTPIAESIVFGELFIENSDKLTEEQKQFFVKKAAEKLGKKYF